MNETDITSIAAQNIRARKNDVKYVPNFISELSIHAIWTSWIWMLQKLHPK
jgi:hypothetical protein